MFDKDIYKHSTFIFKVLLPVTLGIVIYLQLKDDLTDFRYVFLSKKYDLSSLLYAFLSIILMILNWLIESIKWKRLIKDIKEITLIESVNAILNGLAFGIITPFKVGDIFARILHINSDKKSKAFGSLLVSRLSQLVATLLFGFVGLTLFVNEIYGRGFWTVGIILIFIAIIGYLKISYLLKYGNKIPLVNTYSKYVDVIVSYSYYDLVVILFLSLARYLTFVFQYWCFFMIYSLDVQLIDLFVGISIVFLAKSIIPLNFFGGFGIREISAISIFGIMGYSKPMILTITLSVWFINIVIPSILGSFLHKK